MAKRINHNTVIQYIVKSIAKATPPRITTFIGKIIDTIAGFTAKSKTDSGQSTSSRTIALTKLILHAQNAKIGVPIAQAVAHRVKKLMTPGTPKTEADIADTIEKWKDFGRTLE